MFDSPCLALSCFVLNALLLHLACYPYTLPYCHPVLYYFYVLLCPALPYLVNKLQKLHMKPAGLSITMRIPGTHELISEGVSLYSPILTDILNRHQRLYR